MRDTDCFGLILRWKQAIIRSHVALKMPEAGVASRKSQVPKHLLKFNDKLRKMG